MSDSGSVVSVNISKEKGTIKLPVDEIVIDEKGIVDDAHAGVSRRPGVRHVRPERAVCGN